MAYIYKITNNINNKIYIGKTERTVEQRYAEHCKNAIHKYFDYPLYRAMNKYGLENFSVETIEETNSPNEREVYWINFYNSYYDGYNSTLGGEGCRICDYDLIYSLYKMGKDCKEIAQILHYDQETCRIAVKTFGITPEELFTRHCEKMYVPVAQLDKDTEEIIKIFPSVTEANNYLNKGRSGHIASVCKGQRKTAYGYKWKYL